MSNTSTVALSSRDKDILIEALEIYSEKRMKGALKATSGKALNSANRQISDIMREIEALKSKIL